MSASRTSSLAVLLVALGLTACSDGQSTAGAKTGKYTIAVIPMSAQHDFWHSVHAGAVRAAKELGNVEIIWKAPLHNEDRQQQIDIVESMAVLGVDGIVLAPVDNVALAGSVEDAVRQGIPVVIIDSALKSDQQVSFIATDNYQGGVVGAQHLSTLLGGKGKVIMLRNNEGPTSTANREQGFLDTIKKYPGIEVVSSNQRAGATPESAYQKAEQLLATFRKEGGGIRADGIFTSCEPVTFGMMRAMEEEKLIGTVKHVGFDASPALVDGLRKGYVDALVVQDPMKMGYRGIQTIVQHLKGDTSFEQRQDTGVYVVTQKNVDDPEKKDLVAPDLEKWLKDR